MLDIQSLPVWCMRFNFSLFHALLKSFVPQRTSLQARLAAFPTKNLPLQKPATVHWNAYQVPYVVAKTDSDLAFILGLVHLHLRETEINLLKEQRLAGWQKCLALWQGVWMNSYASLILVRRQSSGKRNCRNPPVFGWNLF